MIDKIREHYDLLIDEGNDPVLDPPELKEYMNGWDGGLFIDLMELENHKTVLEIGCGTGRIAVKVAPKVSEYYGIDLSPKTIEVAKTHLPYENVELMVGDFLEMPTEKTFDVVYSSLTFMHVKEKETGIKKVFSLLNDNGKFVLSIDKSQDEILDYGTRKIKVYPDNKEAISSLLSKIGFKRIQIFKTEFAYLIVAEKE